VTTANKKLWPVSRRAFLGGLGAAGFSHLLPGGRLAHAQTGAPRRFVAIYVPEGMWSGVERPSAATFGSVFGPMDPFKSKIVAFDGFDLSSAIADKPGVDNHHRLPHLLGCTRMVNGTTGGGPTLDQRLAKVVGASSTFESLQFGVQIVYTDGSGRLVWKASGQQLPPMESPIAAYERIFGGGGGMTMQPAPGQPGPQPGPAPFDLRKSALDYSLGEIASVQPRLSASDKMKVESYQSSLRDIEKRLAGLQGGPPAPGGPASGGGGTGACARPSVAGAPTDIKAKANFPTIAKLQMDLIVASFQCGLTNVATLQFGNSVDQCTYPWLGVNRSGHDLSHGSARANQVKVYNWYSQQFAYLLGKLQAVPEAGGTMLDNTVVLWVSEFGNSSSHSMSNLMWFMGGNVGGFFRNGQIIKNPGRSVSDIHVSITKAFGIPDDKFGDPAYCSGPVPGLIA
jgi:hypothetical protein